MTVADLIKSSLRKIGAVATGETPSADELNDGLVALNALLDSWSLEKLFIYDTARQTKVLTASQTSTTMGASGDINVTRPNRIERAGLIPSGQSTEYPIDVLTDKEYAQINYKSLTGIPSAIWPEMKYPLIYIYTWPIQTAADTLVLYTWSEISRFTAITSTISLPPGYERALTYNLAVEIASEYGEPAPAEVVAIAIESKAAIKTINNQPATMNCDSALTTASGMSGYIDSSAFRSGL